MAPSSTASTSALASSVRSAVASPTTASARADRPVTSRVCHHSTDTSAFPASSARRWWSASALAVALTNAAATSPCPFAHASSRAVAPQLSTAVVSAPAQGDATPQYGECTERRKRRRHAAGDGKRVHRAAEKTATHFRKFVLDPRTQLEKRLHRLQLTVKRRTVQRSLVVHRAGLHQRI
eukprot:SAG11_NODE_7566_length_1128_cov_1.230321_2_plen_180_part_00